MQLIEERVYLGLTISEGAPMTIMVGSMAAGRWGTVTVAGIHKQEEEQQLTRNGMGERPIPRDTPSPKLHLQILSK